jgi:hypothetical protein
MSAERWHNEASTGSTGFLAWMATHEALMDTPAETPTELLESSRIQWARDWDALAAGFVLGVLFTLAVQGVVF